MSLSNPTETYNPSTRWIDWNGGGDAGFPSYYNKESTLENKNIPIKMPFSFIVLDEMFTIRGWNEPSKSGISSNEVRNISSSKLFVKSFKGGPIASGLYSEIKNHITAAGGYFQTNVYIAYKSDDGKLAIGTLQLAGASLNAWVDFKNKIKGQKNKMAIVITGFVDGKKGAVKYRTPVFGVKEISQEKLNEAIVLDKELQEYFNTYLTRDFSVSQRQPIVEQEENKDVATMSEIEASVVPQPAGDDDPF